MDRIVDAKERELGQFRAAALPGVGGVPPAHVRARRGHDPRHRRDQTRRGKLRHRRGDRPLRRSNGHVHRPPVPARAGRKRHGRVHSEPERVGGLDDGGRHVPEDQRDPGGVPGRKAQGRDRHLLVQLGLEPVSAAGGGGGGAGKAEFQDFSFAMPVSKASPKLFLACASGQHLAEATLTVRKAGDDRSSSSSTRSAT